ncbi:uncharacterized protein LOC133951955 [Platichthys flesus]|uniref:uncharacterized protein LOC133951955 n=1 Tax=Platichthys flesus TaxID=8260 RepID=UPI002DBF453F|nr:uncharacterized protein LOC133951955 [Platichthys flesus]
MDVRRRRKQRADNGEIIANPFDCRCAVALPRAVVRGTFAGATRSSKGKVRSSVVCSVVAAMKHVCVPVCKWNERDVDEVQAVGMKMSETVDEYWWESAAKRKHFCKVLEQHNLFGRMQSVYVGQPKVDLFDMNGESKLYEDLQTLLLEDGMCLLDIKGSTVVVICHQQYFVVVDCDACNESGLPSRNGGCVAVFNTRFDDLMLHINEVRQELKATTYRLSTMSVKADHVTDATEIATVCMDSSISGTANDVPVEPFGAPVFI